MASDAERQIVRPRFYKEAVLNEFKSKMEGRPIYEEEELVEFFIPGDRLTRPVAPAHERSSNNGPTWAEMYSAHYEAFKRGEHRAASGTPLEHWPILTTARVAELKALNILSVDELAGISDSNLRNLGPDARTLREQARTFLEQAKGGADGAAMAAEIERLKNMVEQLMSRPNAATDVTVNEPEPVQSDVVSVDINEATDDQLKQFIKEQTGEAPRGRVSRETLVSRVAELAKDAA